MSESQPLHHLTAQEVETILQYIEQVDAILVGGQSLAIWARLFLSHAPQIARVYSISSEDVDVYANATAAKAFAANLQSARVFIPDPFDNSPNAAVVEGKLWESEKYASTSCETFLGWIPSQSKKTLSP